MNITKKQGKKIIILTAVAIVTAVCGLYILFSPSRERDNISNIQESMIEDILRDIESEEGIEETEGNTELPEIREIVETAITDGDYHYEGEYNGFEDEQAAYEPEIQIPSFTPVYSDPIPDNSFPANVTGIGILTIDSIDLRLPIAEGIEDDSLRIAPGRVPQTAQVGDIGNAVIAGHRNYAYGSMFNRFDEIVIGDIVQYQARNGELMEFEIFEIAEIEPENQIAFLQPLNDSIITLYTCTPVRVASHRLIIRAQRIS